MLRHFRAPAVVLRPLSINITQVFQVPTYIVQSQGGKRNKKALKNNTCTEFPVPVQLFQNNDIDTILLQ